MKQGCLPRMGKGKWRRRPDLSIELLSPSRGEGEAPCVRRVRGVGRRCVWDGAPVAQLLVHLPNEDKRQKPQPSQHNDILLPSTLESSWGSVRGCGEAFWTEYPLRNASHITSYRQLCLSLFCNWDFPLSENYSLGLMRAFLKSTFSDLHVLVSYLELVF